MHTYEILHAFLLVTSLHCRLYWERHCQADSSDCWHTTPAPLNRTWWMHTLNYECKCNNYRHFHYNGTKCSSWPPSQQRAVCANCPVHCSYKLQYNTEKQNLRTEHGPMWHVLKKASAENSRWTVLYFLGHCAQTDYLRLKRQISSSTATTDGAQIVFLCLTGLMAWMLMRHMQKKALVLVIKMSREKKSISNMSVLLLTPGIILASPNSTLWWGQPVIRLQKDILSYMCSHHQC